MRFLFSLSLTIFMLCYSSTATIAQDNYLVCLDDVESVRESLKNENKKLIFTGLSVSQVPFELWASANSYIVFLLTYDGKMCTSPSMTGQTIQINRNIKA
jgi:hypothetical protein